MASTPGWVTAAPACRWANASASPWPAPSSATRRSCVLDEPTASLDAETETDVLDAVRRLTEGRTALVVAHRPALAALADRVVLLPLPAVAP